MAIYNLNTSEVMGYAAAMLDVRSMIDSIGNQLKRENNNMSAGLISLMNYVDNSYKMAISELKKGVL